MVFVRIAESGSITAAANELNFSKSVVSQQLKLLEEALCVTLITRSTRKQVLTDLGQRFYDKCKLIEPLIEESWEIAREASADVIGDITISAPNAFIDRIVTPAVAHILSQYKNVNATIVADDNQLDLIDNKIDVAIRVGQMSSNNYKQCKIGEFKDILCSAPEYLENRLGVVESCSIAKIEQFDYIANAWQGRSISHCFHHRSTNEQLVLNFRPKLIASSLNSIISIANKGLGIALIPDFIFAEKELINLMPCYDLETVPIYSVVPYSKSNPKLIDAFISACQNELEVHKPE